MSEEEFNQAVADNFAKLVRTAEAVLGCHDSARDSVQQALVRIWNNIATFDPKKGAFITLLHVAVKRQAISHLDSRKRRLAGMEFLWAETVVEQRPRKDDPRMDRLMEALGELPEQKRALLQKRFFEGKSVGEIAKEAGLSKSATQCRLHRAEGALLRGYRKKIRT
jgi:RNA polymerase sigma factor (sigma-70 family)